MHCQQSRRKRLVVHTGKMVTRLFADWSSFCRRSLCALEKIRRTEKESRNQKKICQKPRSAQDRAGLLQPKAEPFLHPAVQRPCPGLEVSLGSLVGNIAKMGRL